MEAFAARQVGCGYVYGATGWVCTPQRRARQAAQYPAQKNAILNTCKKWDGKVCYDCAQLTRYAAKAGGVFLPSGAASQWARGSFSAKGSAARKPQNTACLVFRADAKGAIRHVGLCLKDGTVIHAKGSASGVVREAFEKGAWTHCALFCGTLEESDAHEVTAPRGKTVNLRAAPSLNARVLRRVPLGTQVETLGTENGWTRVQTLGVAGYIMERFLV